MPPRKQRTPVVFDTNVIVGQLLSKTRRSANARVYDLWLVRRALQLVVSPLVIDEYLESLERIRIEPERITRFHQRILTAPTVTRVNLGKRFAVSRDMDDDVLTGDGASGARQLPRDQRPRSVRHTVGCTPPVRLRDRQTVGVTPRFIHLIF